LRSFHRIGRKQGPFWDGGKANSVIKAALIGTFGKIPQIYAGRKTDK
jgi:hypothetical protein